MKTFAYKNDPYPLVTALMNERAREADPAWGTIGYLYLVQEGEIGPIKVGIARNMSRRLQSLQCGNPRPLRVVAQYTGRVVYCLAAERAALKKFSSLRSGEWLHTTSDAITRFLESRERPLLRIK